MQARVPNPALNRLLLLLGLVAVLAVSGWFAFAALMYFSNGPSLNGPAGLDAWTYHALATTIPTGASTLLVLLIGVCSWLARPRRSAMFLVFAGIEIASFGLTVAGAFVFWGQWPVDPLALEAYVVASVLAGTLTYVGLFVLLMLALPLRPSAPPLAALGDARAPPAPP